jgi:hypothetical protein
VLKYNVSLVSCIFLEKFKGPKVLSIFWLPFPFPKVKTGVIVTFLLPARDRRLQILQKIDKYLPQSHVWFSKKKPACFFNPLAVSLKYYVNVFDGSGPKNHFTEKF